MRPVAVALLTLAAISCVTLAPAAAATVVIWPELPELAEKADVIVDATVTKVESVSDGGRMWTRTTLSVLDPVKGAKGGDTLVVHQLGGRVGDRQMWISGARKFEVGERFVLFGMRWSKGGDNGIIPYGVGMGVFDIVEDQSARLVVREYIGDVIAYRTTADGTREPAQPKARTWADADSFKSELRGLLATGRAPTLPKLQRMQRATPALGGQR
jgi:hypothetical protein